MRRKRRRYKIKNIIFLIIVICLIIYAINILTTNNENNTNNTNNINNKSSSKKNTNISYLNKISYDKDFNNEIDKQLEKKIIEYMNKYYKIMTTLKEEDMTSLFSKDSYEESYIHQTAISTLVNIRKLEKNDMTISNAKYDIIYKDIKKENDKIIVTFLENDYLHFNFMKDIESKVYGVENTIVFNNSYDILSVRKVQDFYVMITNKYQSKNNSNDIKTELNKIKNEHINDYKKQIKIRDLKKKNYENKKDKPSKECDNNYDRKSALNYAKKYVINKNRKWMDFADIGGNCQNYASQVIHSGGIPMDIVGKASEQWKYYSSELDETNNKKGRSSSWTTVPNFYEYAKSNSGYGLCAKVDINPFYAEAGDIGQVGYDNEYRHSVVIIDSIKDNNGQIVDLLINSNSVNLVNYPLSGYVYPYKRIIKVFGWNNN